MMPKNISVLILLSCVLLSCGKKKGDDTAGPVNCDKSVVGDWTYTPNPSLGANISASCSVSVPACAMSGTIDFKNQTFVELTVKASNPTPDCVKVGKYNCSVSTYINSYYHHVDIERMVLSCEFGTLNYERYISR